MSDDLAEEAVVLDIGASCVRIGLHTQPIAPKITVPTLVGRETRGDRVYYGNAARRPMFEAKCPIENGRIINPEDFGGLLTSCFDLLSLDPAQHRVIVAENSVDPLSRMTLGKVLFEMVGASQVLFVPQGVAGLYSAGATSGLVVDSGESVTTVTPVVDGVGLSGAQCTTSAAGSAVSDELQQQLVSQGKCTVSGLARETVREWKERFCYAALDYEDELAAVMSSGGGDAITRRPQLPDGKTVTIGTERFTAPEVALFQSHDRAFRSSLSEVVAASVQQLEVSLQQPMLQKLLFIGGTSMLTGFSHRLLFDLSASSAVSRIGDPRQLSVGHQEVAPCDRNWIGAAVVGGLSTSRELFVTEDQTREEGLGVLGQNRFMAV